MGPRAVFLAALEDFSPLVVLFSLCAASSPMVREIVPFPRIPLKKGKEIFLPFLSPLPRRLGPLFVVVAPFLIQVFDDDEPCGLCS